MADSKISDLSEDTAPDPAADFVETLDSSATANKKVMLKNVFGGFKGALVKKSVDQTAANYTSETAIAWDAEAYDSGGWHDTVINNSRLTVPSGVTKVRLWGHVRIASTADAEYHIIGITKNGSLVYDGAARQSATFTGANSDITVVSPVLEVTPGDYFELVLFIESDTSVTITATRSSFAIEAVN